MLTKNVTAVREIPGEPGQTMTFRQLGWRQLGEAEETRSLTGLRAIRGMGGEVFAALQNVDTKTVEQRAAAQAADDPLAKLDQATVLLAGIVSWTYPEKVTPDNINALDAKTARWAALEIIKLGAPPIDADVEERFLHSPPTSTATATTALSAALSAPSQTNGSSA